MKNQQLKEMYFNQCSEDMGNIIKEATRFEDQFNKDICDFGYDEAEKAVEGINQDREFVIETLQDYTDFAISMAFSRNMVNVFKIL